MVEAWVVGCRSFHRPAEEEQAMEPAAERVMERAEALAMGRKFERRRCR
jgi:hypothetical protein